MQFDVSGLDAYGFRTGKIRLPDGKVVQVQSIPPILFPCTTCQLVSFHFIGQKFLSGTFLVCNDCGTISSHLSGEMRQMLSFFIIPAQITNVFDMLPIKPYAPGFAEKYMSEKSFPNERVMRYVQCLLKCYASDWRENVRHESFCFACGTRMIPQQEFSLLTGVVWKCSVPGCGKTVRAPMYEFQPTEGHQRPSIGDERNLTNRE